MNIQNSYHNYSKTFKGLWGAENGRHGVELCRINRIYPFADDTEQIIQNQIYEARKDGVKTPQDGYFPISKGIKICERLPFTRKEFQDYKAKEGFTKMAANLTKAEKEYERNIFNASTGNGLSMYLNIYLPPTRIEQLKLFIQKIFKRF